MCKYIAHRFVLWSKYFLESWHFTVSKRYNDTKQCIHNEYGFRKDWGKSMYMNIAYLFLQNIVVDGTLAIDNIICDLSIHHSLLSFLISGEKIVCIIIAVQ